MLNVYTNLDCSKELYPGYYGCTCPYTNEFKCEDMTFNEVHFIFKKMDQWNITEFRLLISIRETNGTIPADFLSTNKVTRFVRIECPSPKFVDNEAHKLRIDVDALRASRNSLKEFSIEYCDLRLLNFSFLAGFELLEDLNFKNSFGIYASFSTLPRLCLARLSFDGMPSLAMSKEFPLLKCGLTSLTLKDCQIDDIFMDLVLTWIASTSKDTLTTLEIMGNALTHIPRSISQFEYLESLNVNLQNNSHRSFQPGSIIIHSQLQFLYMFSCGIQSIEPGTFQGR